MANTTASSRTSAPISASTASAARSTAISIASVSSSHPDTTARNSASCCADQSDESCIALPEGEDDERLIVKAAHAVGARDLAVGVEAGDGRVLRHRRD